MAFPSYVAPQGANSCGFDLFVQSKPEAVCILESIPFRGRKFCVNCNAAAMQRVAVTILRATNKTCLFSAVRVDGVLPLLDFQLLVDGAKRIT